MESDQKIKLLCNTINQLSLKEGGFCIRPAAAYRADATAWAAIALKTMQIHKPAVMAACRRLAHSQMEDGRVALSPDYPIASWPTSLAIMAWEGFPEFEKQKLQAVRFLLSTSGNRFKNAKQSILGHNTSIMGWPWIDDTHSWVEPTSLALFALEITRNGNHNRAKEARKMLMNRQLNKGGWNYGNTSVFGQELRPMPDSTGMALEALSGHIESGIEKSLSYLGEQITDLTTPLSLAWSIIGLSAYNFRPAGVTNLIARCLDKQKIFGGYDGIHFSLLVIAYKGKKGFTKLLT
jgi:hypothetical protein